MNPEVGAIPVSRRPGTPAVFVRVAAADTTLRLKAARRIT
jgi:hypothetical protein